MKVIVEKVEISNVDFFEKGHLRDGLLRGTGPGWPTSGETPLRSESRGASHRVVKEESVKWFQQKVTY